jgi:hypothetical protein
MDATRNEELRLAPKIAEPHIRAMGRAIRAEWGFQTDALEILVKSNPRGEAELARSDRPDVLIARLISAGLTEHETCAMIAHFTISADPTCDGTASEHQPHRTGRPNSYVWNIFIPLADGSLAWSPGHVMGVLAGVFYRGLCGGHKGSRAVELASDAISKRLSSEYNCRLARAVRRLPEWLVFVNVTFVGGLDLKASGLPLGDVDVLALHRVEPIAIAIEAKRIQAALGPYETWKELDRFHGKRGYVARHARRCDWLRNHPEALSNHANHSAGRDWTVRGVIATTVPLLAGYREAKDIPIVPCWDLIAWMSEPQGSFDGPIKALEPKRAVTWPRLQSLRFSAKGAPERYGSPAV